MAGVVPRTAPPAFGGEYADRQAQSRRLDEAMVQGDLNRRSSLMQNIISNAPNIAALSGVGTVDQLANMFADSETPIFNNEYGQTMDALRLRNAAQPKGRGGGAKTKGDGTGVPAGVNIDPNTVPVLITSKDGQVLRTVMDMDTYKQTFTEFNDPDNPMFGGSVVLDFHGANPYTNTTNKAGYPEVTAPGVAVPTPAPSNIVKNEDGTWTNTDTGVTVDAEGNVVER